jgi:putative transposase
MREYRRSAHTVYALHYHFIFIPKYRKPVLRGEVGTEVRDLIREICRTLDIEILQGHIRPDHVHLLLSVPPHLAPSRVMQAIKGKTSHHLLQDHRLRAEFWGRHLWARGYFVASRRPITRRDGGQKRPWTKPLSRCSPLWGLNGVRVRRGGERGRRSGDQGCPVRPLMRGPTAQC